VLGSSSPPQLPSKTSSAGIGRRLLLALLVVVFALSAAYGALVLVSRIDEILFPGNGLRLTGSLGKLPGVDSGAGAGTQNDRINFLVMGLDLRPREGDVPSRSDTMFILTLDPRTKTASILGIPRDLYVEIPDGAGSYYEDRINTAFIMGEINGYPGGGYSLAIDTVEHNLGIDVDHYIIIDFEGFEELIDALGGIEVDVPEYLYDPYYSPTELPGDYHPYEFEPGLQHMDGETALAYARIRRYSNDFDRIQRQQRIIFAVMDKALDLNVLGNALDLWKKYKDAIDTDVNDFQIPGLAKLAGDTPPEQVAALSLGACTTDWTTPLGAEVLLPSEKCIQRLVQALFSDQSIAEENAIVEIQDGTDEEGLAEESLELLTDLGFPEQSLISVLPPDGAVFSETVILDYSAGTKGYTLSKLADCLEIPSERVRQALPGEEALRTTNADIVIQLGPDVQFAAEE
jgi:LCP family protein required for cell wall assembly